MSEELLTHRDLAVRLGVSETTIKSYRRKFPGSIPVANNGKPIRFKPEAGNICLRIRDLFSTGMSIEEVGARLNQEFGWRKPKNIESARGGTGSADRKPAGGVDLSQSFATALSNMAKSMISLNQSQAGIIDTMKRIEMMLADMGLGAFQQLDANGINAERRKSEAATIDSLNGLNKLTANIGSMLESANAALEESRKLGQQQAAENIRVLQSVEALSNEVRILSERQNAPLSAQQTGQAVPAESLQPQPATNQPPQKVFNLHQPAVTSATSPLSSGTAKDVQPEHLEVPRHILHLPLVVRLDDGSYISAGGNKVLGKISLNDVKAILAQSCQPPDNFTLRWEQGPEGLWAILEQAASLNRETAQSLRFLVAEITSSRGLGVLEIRNLFERGAAVHPVEFCRFITDIVK